MLHAAEQAKFIERRQCINCGSAHLKELSRGRYDDEPLSTFMKADPIGAESPFQFLLDATWTLVKCVDCSQVFHHRILDEEWNERRFTRWMDADSIRQFEARLGADLRFNSAVHDVEHILRIRRLVGKPDLRLLDFGCGFGAFVGACVHFGFDAVGVDRSSARRAESAIKILPSLDDVVGTFDVITLFEVLEHLDEPATVLKRLSCLLATNGLLILETPDCNGVTDIKTRHDYLMAHPLEHINCFTHETLSSIAERQGFSMIARGPAFITADPYRVLKRFAKHTLLRDGGSTQLYFRKA